jgi:hypothetical protein
MAHTGHVKRNPATGEVAVRSIFDEDEPSLAGQAWLVVSPSRGARFVASSETSDWNDLYVADPPE